MVPVSRNHAYSRADESPVTLRQVIANSTLAKTGEIVAGANGLERVVTDVIVGALRGSSSSLSIPSGALAILASDGLRTDTYQIDMAVRHASESNAAGIVLCTERSNIVLAATRLANKLRVPVIVTETDDPVILADALRSIVLQPRMVRSDVLLSMVTALSKVSSGVSTETILSQLAEELGAEVALVNAEGSLVSGDPSAQPIDSSSLLEVPTTSVSGPFAMRAQPLSLARREPPSFWLLGRMMAPTKVQESIVSDGLLIATWFLGTRLVADRLERERDARFRLGVLNSIIGLHEGFDAVPLQNLATLGWNVDGWCSAIHLQASGESDALRILTLTDQLSGALREAGISGPLVERPDGWTSWITDRQEPKTTSYRDVSNAVSIALSEFRPLAPRINIHVGIGRPYRGLDGLRTSLSEAREASTVAQAAGGQVRVQHIDEMGVRRILLGWYASDSFAEFARTLLGPLLDQDGDGGLLHTLEVYLDEESSATLAAARLQVHRNTILNRIERLRGLLTVNLEDPEERLAVQLACRVIKLKRDEHLL